ncbi:DUF1353 domain-containing protein [Terrabacter terrigena]|uniref:DUF1353 domain-containing protein n=1 Tax=Terrabacter terrigena TaxID=574718 RepID=A0ABW3N1N2_9MICO
MVLKLTEASEASVPFYDLDDSGQPVGPPKTEVQLIQLPEPLGFNLLRLLYALFAATTMFRCVDRFGWADRPGQTPDPLSVVPANTKTDLASIPSFLWGIVPSYGRHTMCAVLHDVRCDEAAEARKAGHRQLAARRRRLADNQFRATLKRHARLGPITRWIMWAAVRLFGYIPLGATAVVGILAAMLHHARPTFTAIAAALDGVTIWPWLAPLDFLPKTIASGLAWCSDQMAGQGTYLGVVGGLAGLALLLAAIRSIEADGPVDGSSQGPAAFSPAGFGGLIAALVVGALALPPLLPLIVVTLLTRVVLALFDYVGFAIDWLRVKIGLASDDDKATPPTPPRLPGLPTAAGFEGAAPQRGAAEPSA